MAIKLEESVVYANAFYTLDEYSLTTNQLYHFANLVDKLLPDEYYTTSYSVGDFYEEFSYMFKRRGDLLLLKQDKSNLERRFRYGMPIEILEVFDKVAEICKQSNTVENGFKIISHDEIKKKKNSEVCLINEYNLEDKDIDMVKAIITGRYPKEGYALNEISKELIYIINGEGTINFENESKSFSRGDTILIDKNTKFYWDSEYVEATITCTPPFDKNQYKLVK